MRCREEVAAIRLQAATRGKQGRRRTRVLSIAREKERELEEERTRSATPEWQPQLPSHRVQYGVLVDCVQQQPQPQPEEHSRQRRPDVAAEASIVAPSGATHVDIDGHVAVPSDMIRVRELLPLPGESQEEDGAAGSDLAQLQQELFARYETAAVFLSLSICLRER
eukprot:COSAG06_NODE_1987_length_7906_cov_36.391315_11_plen_166_part_00